MKRLSIALAAIGLSAGALAALPAATDPTVVSVPQLPGGFVVGATAYYMEALPTNGDLDYASVNFGTSSTFFSELKEVEPGYDWGWGVNVGYIFPNTGNDINLSYFQLDTDDTDHIAVVTDTPVFGFILPIFNEVTNFTGSFFFAAAKAEYDIHQVDLTAGQYIDIGCRLIAHPYAGLRWAQVDRDLDSFFVGTGVGLVSFPFLAVREKSDFDGIGPIAGIDASYYIYMGFGAVAHFDTALLVGNIDTDTDIFANQGGTGLTTPFFNALKIDDNNRVVPVLDAKLGLDYTYVFNNCENSDLTLEVGWQVSNYFNAVDRVNTFVDATGADFIQGRTTSDVGIQGPYVSLVFHA